MSTSRNAFEVRVLPFLNALMTVIVVVIHVNMANQLRWLVQSYQFDMALPGGGLREGALALFFGLVGILALLVSVFSVGTFVWYLVKFLVYLDDARMISTRAARARFQLTS